MVFTIAALVFLSIVVLIVGLWWVSQANRGVRARLARASGSPAHTQILRPELGPSEQRVAALLEGSGLSKWVSDLTVQAGYKGTPGDLILLMTAFGAVGGAGAWLRTGGAFWGVLAALFAGSVPLITLLYKRSQRLNKFQGQFPDALDMITRAIRAGNALSGAIRIVSDEMPDPVGEEFKRIDEEIRLGMEPGEALFRLLNRVPTEDTRFFCTAIKIQRSTGGNLAEILERLAEVIRERFKILSYARVLSAQHRWTAILVGLSPVIFGVMFQILNPGFFDPLFSDPVGPKLIVGGLILEAIGFFMIWRIAQLRV